MDKRVHTTASDMMAVSGLDAIRGILEGRFPQPSISETLGFRLAEADFGRVVFEGEPSERVLNPMGAVHGGWALTLIDSACGAAGHTTLPAGVGYGTLETKANFVRPIGADTGLLRCERQSPGAWPHHSHRRSQAHRRCRQALRARHVHLHDHPSGD